MTNILTVKNEAFIYAYNDKRATLASFAESCIANEAKAEAITDNAYLLSTAGVVCMLIKTEQTVTNKRDINKALKVFISEAFSKANKPIPNERMLQRRVQLARFVLENNAFLRDYTTTPPALIRESLQVVSKYKTYHHLLELATQNTGKHKEPASDIEKLMKRVDSLFKDMQAIDKKEGASIVDYIKEKADAFMNASVKQAKKESAKKPTKKAVAKKESAKKQSKKAA